MGERCEYRPRRPLFRLSTHGILIGYIVCYRWGTPAL